MSRLHQLKTDPKPFQAAFDNAKRAEIRNNDRGFEVGDILELRESNETRDGETGRYCFRLVTHIQLAYGLLDGYVVLSMRPLTQAEKASLKP